MTGGDCLDDQGVLDFLEGRLGPDRVAGFELHLDGCAACRALVNQVQAASFALRATIADGPRARTSASFTPGDRLAERYRVVRFIAQGGMGEVYEVEDEELGERVALKTIRADLARHAGALERFRREV